MLKVQVLVPFFGDLCISTASVMRSSIISFAILLVAECLASPAKLGLSFDRRANALPTLKLPYATYQASNYNLNGDVSKTYFSEISILRTIGTDLYLQKYTFRCSTCRRSTCKSCFCLTRYLSSQLSTGCIGNLRDILS